MSNPLIAFLKLLSPRRCVACRRFGPYFCIDCLKHIRPIFHQKCTGCGQVSHGGATHGLCQKRYGLDGLFSLFKYQGAVRAGITKLKYGKLTDIKFELAELVNLGFQIQGEHDILSKLESYIVGQHPVVVPVPLHWWKKAKRGFNQAEIIGEILADEYDLPMLPRVLKRKFRLLSQTKLKSKERIKNTKGIYYLNSDYMLKNRIDPVLENILLVDDVTTTGSTLKQATIALKKRGVKRVWGVSLAT